MILNEKILIVLSFIIVYIIIMGLVYTARNKTKIEKHGTPKTYLDKALVAAKGVVENEQLGWIIAFIIVLIVSILLYTKYDAGSERWETIGLWMIAGLHILILYDFYRTVMFGEKLHWKTKVFIVGFVAFIVYAWVLPQKADKLIVDTKAAISAYDKSKPEEESPIVHAIYHPETKPVVLSLVAPAGRFEYRLIPDNQIVSAFDCPRGAIMVIAHKGLQQGREHDCDKAEDIPLGRDLVGLKIGFMSKSEDSKFTYLSLTPR